MPKLPLTAVFEDHPTKPYMNLVKFGGDELTYRTLALSVPGFTSEPGPDHGACSFPPELDVVVAGLFRKRGYVVKDNRQPRVCHWINIKHDVAHEYQILGAAKLLHFRTYMLNYEMGLGKTLTAIMALKHAEPKKTLIVCPANVRNVWIDQLAKWWPEHPSASEIETGNAAVSESAAPADIVITSYELAKYFRHLRWDCIILDESHYIANQDAKRSKVIREILTRNPKALRWALTATPITNEPIGLWHQLDAMWPSRFGTYHDFAYHYCEVGSTDYTDFWVHGVNKAYAKELWDRLDATSHRVTKHEVAHLLPSFVVTPIRVKARRGFDAKAILQKLSVMDFHKETKASEAIIRACGSQKIGEAVAWAKDAVSNGQKITVLTHLKRSAKDIEAKLKAEKVLCWRFDGDTPPKGRRALIMSALKSPQPGVLVCTMHSVKEGINTMAGFDGALLAELYYTPGVMSQVLGRFHRAENACNVWILYVEGSHEEIIAMRLSEKMENSGRVMKKAKTEEALAAAFAALDEEDLGVEFEELRRVAAARAQEDAYG